MEIKKYIEENEQRFIDELFSLIRIPSISAYAYLASVPCLSIRKICWHVPKDGDNS